MRRRTFLVSSAAALAAPRTALARSLEPDAAAGGFPLGVWSGQPNLRAITLGTKVDGLERASKLTLEIARDPDFRRVIYRDAVRSAPVRDFAIKERVLSRALAPGERYWYRFATRTSSSPIGRFTTARPADSREPLRIGFFSCQQYENGFYTAHRGLASEPDLDLIVCVGDYIYEHDGDEGIPGRVDKTSSGENGEAETLADYRAKYRLYRGDPDIQAMHASAAFACTWDDHEVENNHAGKHPGTTADRRIPYEVRKANAYTAFFEHMPIQRIRSDRDRIYRKLRLGGIVDLFVLDQRQYRDDQACNDQPAVPCPESEDAGRTLLGPAQKAWFKAGLERSTAAWKVVASSTEVMSWQSVPTAALNYDGWDGYKAERREILGHVLDKGVQDVTFLTGDIHHFVCGDVHLGGDSLTPRVATEFVGGSITSEFVNEYGVGATAFQVTNPHFKYMDFTKRGYGLLEATPQRLHVAFRSPLTTRERTSPMRTLASFVVERGMPVVQRT